MNDYLFQYKRNVIRGNIMMKRTEAFSKPNKSVGHDFCWIVELSRCHDRVRMIISSMISKRF